MEVFGMVRSSTHRPVDSLCGVHLFQHDLTSPIRDSDLLNLCPQSVFHLAAAFPSDLDINGELVQLTNYMGTYHVLEYMRASCPGAIGIFVSSSAVYGPQQDEEIISEDHPLRPLTPYGISKLAAETLVMGYARTHRLNIVVVRPFNLVGPGQPVRLMCASLMKQIVDAELGLAAPILRVGPLMGYRDFLDVRDAAAALLLVALHGRPGEAYNVCSGRSVQVQWVLEHLIDLSPTPIKNQQNVNRENNQCKRVSYHKLHDRSGWRPLISLERSLEDQLASWRKLLQRRVTAL